MNKFLADSGIASRRKADDLITEGKVKVNGQKVFELGLKVHPTKDSVTVDGKKISAKTNHLYIMFNKPKGVITSMSDPLGRPSVADFFMGLPMRVFPIGRLDWDSEGLLLLTSDGEYSQKVMHPKEEVTKTYLVKLDQVLGPKQIERLTRGLTIPGGRVRAELVEKIKKGRDEHPWYKIVIIEGKNRQIRFMFQKFEVDVLKLQRVAIGKLRLGNLDRGQFVFMNQAAAERVFLPDTPDRIKEDNRRRRTVSSVKPKPKTANFD